MAVLDPGEPRARRARRCRALRRLLLGFLLQLVRTVLIVIGLKIGLRLLRRELGGSGSLRIPGKTERLFSIKARTKSLFKKTGRGENIPLYGESRYSRLVRKNVAADLVNNGLGRGIGGELVGLVFIVDVVAHADELAAVVGAGQQDDGDAEDVGVGDAAGLGRVGLEDELVHTDGDRADEERVQLLVILITAGRNAMLGRASAMGIDSLRYIEGRREGLRCGRADIG